VGEKKEQGMNRGTRVGSQVTTLAGETPSGQYRGFLSQMTWLGSFVYVWFGRIFPRTEGSIYKTPFIMCLKTVAVSVASPV